MEKSNLDPLTEGSEKLDGESSNPWDADWEISENLVRELIYHQFPHLNSLEITKIGMGFDNTVYRVGKDFVFRFPRRKVAIPGLILEGRVLPKLNDYMTLPYSKPLFYGKWRDISPLPFLGYTYLPGSFPLGLTDEQRALSTSTLAQFLKKLHAFPLSIALENDVSYDSRDLLNISSRKERMIGFLTVLKPHLQIEQFTELSCYLHQLNTEPIKPINVFLHGDLHFKNILVNEFGQVSGMIDWGDMNIGHPACDLSIVYSFLPAHERQSFFKEYGEVDEQTKVLARLIAIYIPMIILMQAIDDHEDVIADEAKACIKRALSH